MANKEFTLESGAKLNVTSAPFADAHALLKSLLKSAKGVPLSQNVLDMDVTTLKDAILSAAVSDEVEQALFKCMQRSVYENQKVTRDLFDTVDGGDKAREDYYPICWHVIEVNCGPFFGKAFSSLRERLKKPVGRPESPSTPTRPS